MELIGKILAINDVEVVGISNFKKRKLYLDRRRKDDYSDQEYLNFNEVIFLGEDKTKLPDNFEVGDVVKIQVIIQGGFYTNAEQQQRFSQDVIGNSIKLIRKTKPTSNEKEVDGKPVY